MEVQLLLILNAPARRLELGVDLLAGFGFEFRVLRGQFGNSFFLAFVADKA
jgi:hypothetical protein